VALPISRLVIGCDNRDSLEAGAPVWDAWMEAGGNAFDTAFVYGAGRHEAVLGQWIAARGVAAEIVVIVKGAHTPHCTPEAMAGQLDASLDRLGLDRAPVYILHRDNPEVPVGEFVDALNRLHEAGRIGVFGGSNWSVARFAQANAHAAARGLQPMRILNNHLSLAVMQRPVWAGCLASNDPETLAWLRATGTAHLAWSSQARGFFLPAEARSRLSDDTSPESCFGGPANEERRRRAEVLAARYGVSTHNIATAWVLAQAFPSFAIVGPRTPGEVASTLPGLVVALEPADAAWLNLEAGQPA
jgi:aryl-alcohol dehydrogenase-like predicted oxidoreductase